MCQNSKVWKIKFVSCFKIRKKSLLFKILKIRQMQILELPVVFIEMISIDRYTL